MAGGACRGEAELLRPHHLRTPLAPPQDCLRTTTEEEDDEDLHSPCTDASDDSVEVKVLPILALSSKKNKRKLAEPRKVPPDGKGSTPAKRSRRAPRNTNSAAPVTEILPTTVSTPFRPWSEPAEEPLSLVLRPAAVTETSPVLCGAKPTVKLCERPSSKFSVESLLGEGKVAPPHSTPQPPPPPPPPSSSAASSVDGGCSKRGGSNALGHPAQRNYKNMTRERRIEANARERTRVHTISAAFDTLRRSIPSYSHSQKLSKLSILRIACSYIVALSRINGLDYSKDATEPSMAECVESVTATLHAEGKVRKKKED